MDKAERRLTEGTHTHHDVAEDADIPSLCKKTFVSISRAVTVMWVAGVVLILPATICSIRWSIAVGAEQTKQNEEIKALNTAQGDIKKMDVKLDEVLKTVKERRY